MIFAQLNAFGIPSQFVDCIEGEEPGAPESERYRERFMRTLSSVR